MRLVLPPGWIALPLERPEECQRIVDRIVAGLPLDDGSGARMRRELRDDLRRQTEEARNAGASLLAISGPRSAPLSGSLVLTPLRPRAGDDDPGWADDLVGRQEVLQLDVGRVVRIVRPRYTDFHGQELPSLTVDYLVQGPGALRALLSFATPLVEHEEAMVQLFDAVVATASWETGESDGVTTETEVQE